MDTNYSRWKTNVSQAGIDFYNRVIDTCEKYNVEPFVTLYHYDMPIEYFKMGDGKIEKQLKRLLNMQKSVLNISDIE